MTLLESVTLKSPLNIHGIQVRYVTARTPIIRASGEAVPGWDLYLHAEWHSVGVVQDGVHALVPLAGVESMVLAPGVTSAVSGVSPGPGPGRPRSKRLGLV